MTQAEKLKAEQERINAIYSYQNSLLGDHSCIFGIDEAGRGPLCGPVVAACVLLPDEKIMWLNDSKQLTEKKREELFPIIKEKAITYGIGIADVDRINEINILNATFEAMKDAWQQAMEKLKAASGGINADHNCLVLVDGNKTVPGIHEDQLAVVSGDAKCPSIAAASILAKVTRDHILTEYDKQWPEYGFAKHKGYGTKQHIEAIKTHGALPIHRTKYIEKFI